MAFYFPSFTLILTLSLKGEGGFRFFLHNLKKYVLLSRVEICPYYCGTFEKCPILVKVKEDENFNHRNILNISRIKI